MGNMGARQWIRPVIDSLPSKKKMGIAVIILLAFLVLATPLFNRWMYPIRYEDDILNSAETTGADPFLVMAIIRVESKFDPKVRSRAGAQGLMQLTPETVDLVVDRGKFSPAFKDYVHDPAINIHMGAWYIAALTREYKGNEVAAIAAYNAGPGNVHKWMRQGRWNGTRKEVKRIPFGETRHYIQRVFYYKEKYRAIYAHLTKKRNFYTRPE
ncbi:lytic transglycosylase domain-containing protein [Marininema halotolerans]|uniref:Soluble lytic murein transglycosylase n=1 Tax=Marininema halotolerans TaxID=1155944 RepID=A0A1I6S4N0_9BACL|nr:lytic transglycosylase domain-containing protein [Marininema halotolerans]SFS71896.1 soluble lytic murein transglycosylase [Marininema halotolerans]